MANDKQHFTFGVPNIVTMCRVALTPLLVVYLLSDKFVMALAVFIIAGISDGLDGFVARCFNQRTVLGTYLDPIADKCLLVTAFICLTILDVIPEWVVLVVISREFLIVFGIFVLFIMSKCNKVEPTFLSKCNTVIQIIVVFESLFLLVCPDFYRFHASLCWVAVVITILSGLQYIFVWVDMLHREVEHNFGTDG